jgi:parallel beta-helix repeat protein
MTLKIISPVANNQQFNNSGQMLSGGTITVYQAGTLTLATIYANSAGGALANPITLNSSGRIPNGEIYLDVGLYYDIVIKSGSTVLETYNNVTGVGNLNDANYVTTTSLSSASGSNLVGYTSGTSNSVPRTVQAKLMETISVKDFGAKGDGVTDDTVAINRALTDGAGKEVYFPTGTYSISSTLVIQSNTRLAGVGQGGSVIKLSTGFPAASAGLANANSGGTPNTYYDNNIEIIGLRFDGNSNATRTGNFVEFAKTQDCVVSECEFINHTYICIAIGGSRNVKVYKNTFKNNGRPKPSTVSTPCVWTATGYHGIPKDIYVDHNTFIDNNWSCSYFMPTGGSFSFNYCLNNGESGVFTNDTGKDISYIGNTIIGQTRSNISASGIETGGNNLIISGNNIQNCAADGISLTDTTNVLVSDNIILNNGQETSYFVGASGIQLITYAGSTRPDHIRITQNRIGDTQTIATQNSGIRVNGPSALAVKHVAIHDNDLTGQRSVDFDINAAKWDSATCYTKNNYLIDGSIDTSSGSTVAGINGGVSNQILYQSAPNTTAFISSPGGTVPDIGGYLSYSSSTGFGWSNTLKAVTYATSDGTAAGSNAYFGEDSQYATIGGKNGLVVASGTTYPGTPRYVGDSISWRPFANGSYSLGTSIQRWTTIYGADLNLSGSVTGGTWNGNAIGIAKGGTGLTSIPTNGQILIGNGTGYAANTLTAGTGVTITNSPGAITISASGAGSGTVTSVNASGGTTGMTFSGGPITTTGSLTLGGTLNVANGGTGSSSLDGAGIVTKTGNQSITGAKAFTSLNNQYTGLYYSTSNGTSSNGYIGEDSQYAVIGGVLGTVFAIGPTYPGVASYVADTNSIRPFTDSVKSLGTSAQRWTTVYAVTGTINTSDGREKTEVREISEVERLVAERVRKLFRAFKWKSSIAEKGIDGARIHFGLIAQELAAAFAAEGLDADKYGMFCSDTWTNDAGETITRLGVRYDELLCFMMANMD